MFRLMDVILPSLNTSSTLINSEAFRLLGATRSNTAVLIAALQNKYIDALPVALCAGFGRGPHSEIMCIVCSVLPCALGPNSYGG